MNKLKSRNDSFIKQNSDNITKTFDTKKDTFKSRVTIRLNENEREILSKIDATLKDNNIKVDTNKIFKLIIKNTDPDSFAKHIIKSKKQADNVLEKAKKEALQDYNRMYSEYASGEIYSKINKIDFLTLGKKFLKSRELKQDEPSTLIFYRNLLEKYLQPELGFHNINEISPDFLNKVFKRIKEKKINDTQKISIKTYNHILKTCRSVFEFGIRQRMISFNPAKSVDLIKIPESPFSFLEREQVVQLLTYAKATYTTYTTPYYLYLLGFNLGLRVGELVALKWTHINFERKSILIHEAYDRIAKRIKPYTKSKRYRHLFMNETVENALRELQAIGTDSKFILTNPTGINHIHQRNFDRRVLKKDIKEIGIEHFNLHGMRHTFAILYLMNGGEAHDLQLLMGHENVNTTMKYVKFSSDYLKSKVSFVELDAKLPEAISKFVFRKK